MNPPVQNIRVSQRGKEALQRLKNRTGIENWNVLCRWAVSASLGMDTPPPRWIAQEESNIDMASELVALMVLSPCADGNMFEIKCCCQGTQQ